MAKYKSIIKKYIVKPAGGKRKCYHDKNHIIKKGEFVIEIYGEIKLEGAYCSQCALEIIKDGIKDLNAIKEDIYNI
jgi:hypothetical protein